MLSKKTKIFCQHSNKNREQNGLTPHDTSVSEAVDTEFLYTLNNSRLSWYQRKFYDENGFLLIRRLVDDDVLDACSQRFVDICEGRVPKGNMILMKDISLINTGVTGEFLYNKVQDIVWDEVMTKYIFFPKLLDYVECFTGPNIMAIHTMLINKPPDSGKMTSIHPLHQDLHYFPFRPADRIVAAWTAMEKVTMDNGCLVVIPGTHKGKLEQHDYPETENGVNKGYHGVKGFEDLPLVTLEMEKGDTVFFHPKLVHGSGVNKTKGFRKAISSHYASSDCHCIEVKGTTQEKVSQEIEEMAKKRGFELDYQRFVRQTTDGAGVGGPDVNDHGRGRLSSGRVAPHVGEDGGAGGGSPNPTSSVILQRGKV